MSDYRGAAGVIGWPVAHSKSPIIHRFWLQQLGLDGDYGRFAVSPDHLAQALRALPALGLRGVNVTVPHKIAVMAHCDAIDESAHHVGAVNTIIVQEDGRLYGLNSDVAGFAEPLVQHRLAGKRAAIIGAGGATRAVIAALQNMQVEIVALLNRTAARAEQLVAEFAVPQCAVLGLDAALPAVDLLVNASTMGLKNVHVYAPDLSALPDHALVYDIVYDPIETALLAKARARGLKTIDGLDMLIGQAAVAFAHFYGVSAPRTQDGLLKKLLLA